MFSAKTRGLVFSLFALTLLAALSAFAGEEAVPAAAPQIALPAAGCASALARLDSTTPDVGVPAWLDLNSAKASPLDVSSARKFHGFCPCGCSFIPDCNTSADCFGGATCQTAPSCC